MWNEQIRMEVLDPSEELGIQVFDEEKLRANDLVCEGTIDLASLCVSDPVDEWFNLQYKGKNSGKIHLKTKFIPQS